MTTGAPHILNMQGSGGTDSFNIHNSVAFGLVDTQTFKPNFRLFDWHVQQDPPDPGLMERVWKVPEGEAHWSMQNILGGNARSVPVIYWAIPAGYMVTTLYVGNKMRPTYAYKWVYPGSILTCILFTNIMRYILREKEFQRDFRRNQSFAIEELKKLREEQKVREAIYRKQFTYDPIAEYRVKIWQSSTRMD